MNNFNRHNHADQDPIEVTFWYILVDAKQQGPVYFSRLRQMAHQGKLSHDDKVRKGTAGEWVRAGDIEDLPFPNVAEVEAMAAQQTAVEQKPVVRQPKQPGFLAKLVSSIRDRLEGLRDGVLQLCSDRLGSARSVVSWIAFVGVFGSLTVVLAKYIPLDDLFAGDPIKTYTVVWNELKEKRNSKATAAEWAAFVGKSRRAVLPIVARLERTANCDDRVSQQLLWAGRDYLLKMLDDAHDQVSPSEEYFEQEFRRAIWLTQGKNLSGRGGFVRHQPRSFFLSDTMTGIFGIAFVIVDVGIVVWFLQGRRNATNTA